MRTATALTLVAIGAILAFAVTAEPKSNGQPWANHRFDLASGRG
jgi:hypothetical protein